VHAAQFRGPRFEMHGATLQMPASFEESCVGAYAGEMPSEFPGDRELPAWSRIHPPYAELFAAKGRRAPEATSSRGGQAKHTAYTDFVFRSHLGCRSYSASKSWGRARRAANVGWVGGITPRARHPTHGYKGRDTGRRNGTKKNLPAWPSERFLASEPPHGTRAVLDRWLPGSDPQSTAET